MNFLLSFLLICRRFIFIIIIVSFTLGVPDLPFGWLGCRSSFCGGGDADFPSVVVVGGDADLPSGEGVDADLPSRERGGRMHIFLLVPLCMGGGVVELFYYYYLYSL